tara:strand:+ start:481 stop:861 length:381 start_codon:yes stop_codon:yes gene_type:complete
MIHVNRGMSTNGTIDPCHPAAPVFFFIVPTIEKIFPPSFVSIATGTRQRTCGMPAVLVDRFLAWSVLMHQVTNQWPTSMCTFPGVRFIDPLASTNLGIVVRQQSPVRFVRVGKHSTIRWWKGVVVL